MIPLANETLDWTNQHSLKGTLRTQVSAFVYKAIYSNNTSIWLQRHLIWDIGLAWESSSKQSSTYFCEIHIWHIRAHFQWLSMSSTQKWEACCKTEPLYSKCDFFHTLGLQCYHFILLEDEINDDDDDDDQRWWFAEHLPYARHWTKNFLLFTLYDNPMIWILFLLSPFDRQGEIEAGKSQPSLRLLYEMRKSEMQPRFGCF